MKKIDFKNQKVIVGLIALLFMTSFVNTQAILKIANPNGQSASAGLGIATLTKACLQATPVYNAIQGAHTMPGDPDRLFTMYFDVKNVCSTGVELVNTETFLHQTDLPITSLAMVGLQIQNALGNPLDLDPSAWAGQGIAVQNERLICTNCTGFAYYPSPTAGFFNGEYALGAYSIPPGATKRIEVYVLLTVAGDSNDTLRVTLKKLRWFTYAAASDNTITAQEIGTFNLPTTNLNAISTDYTTIFYQ